MNDARQQRPAIVVTQHLGLVRRCVHRYRWAQCAALDADDLFQAGVLGLMRAAERFDPSLGFQFSTLATWWIRQAIVREIQNKSRAVRFPVWLQERAYTNGVVIPSALSLDAGPRGEASSDEAPSLLTTLASPIEPTDAAADRRESRALAARALKSLPKRLRRVLWWRTVRGMTLREIGDRLGRSHECARLLERQALQMAREAIESDSLDSAKPKCS